MTVFLKINLKYGFILIKFKKIIKKKLKTNLVRDWFTFIYYILMVILLEMQSIKWLLGTPNRVPYIII